MVADMTVAPNAIEATMHALHVVEPKAATAAASNGTMHALHPMVSKAAMVAMHCHDSPHV
jgi:DNA-binding FadR family transcriptional regulator